MKLVDMVHPQLLGTCHINGNRSNGVEGCIEAGAVGIGQVYEIKYCPAHAADLALQLLALPAVQAALAERRMAVLVLDEGKDELQLMDIWLRKVEPLTDDGRQFTANLRQRLEDRLNAMYPTPPDAK